MDNINTLSLPWVDIVILSIIFISIVISLFRGFFKEALSLLTWGLAIFLAIRFYPLLSTHLLNSIKSVSLRNGIAFFAIFLIILIIGGICSYFFSLLIKKTGLGGTDRFLGMIFGLARGALVVGLILLVLSFSSVKEESWWQSSHIIPHFQVLMDWLKEFVPDKLKNVHEDIKAQHHSLPELLKSAPDKKMLKRQNQAQYNVSIFTS